MEFVNEKPEVIVIGLEELDMSVQAMVSGKEENIRWWKAIYYDENTEYVLLKSRNVQKYKCVDGAGYIKIYDFPNESNERLYN